MKPANNEEIIRKLEECLDTVEGTEAWKEVNNVINRYKYRNNDPIQTLLLQRHLEEMERMFIDKNDREELMIGADVVIEDFRSDEDTEDPLCSFMQECVFNSKENDFEYHDDDGYFVTTSIDPKVVV